MRIPVQHKPTIQPPPGARCNSTEDAPESRRRRACRQLPGRNWRREDEPAPAGSLASSDRDGAVLLTVDPWRRTVRRGRSLRHPSRNNYFYFQRTNSQRVSTIRKSPVAQLLVSERAHGIVAGRATGGQITRPE